MVKGESDATHPVIVVSFEAVLHPNTFHSLSRPDSTPSSPFRPVFPPAVRAIHPFSLLSLESISAAAALPDFRTVIAGESHMFPDSSQ